MTGQSPFEILMGYSPRAEIFDVTLSIPTVALWLRDWKRAREEAQKLMIKCYVTVGTFARRGLGSAKQRH